MIDVRSLRYVICVADHQSLRKAARAIEVSQCAINRRIPASEDRIFIRVVRKAVQDIDVAVSTAGSAERMGTVSCH
jgi:DNA-binding transcriptional LysR family regulator